MIQNHAMTIIRNMSAFIAIFLLFGCSRRVYMCGMKGRVESNYFVPISSLAHLREQYRVTKIDSTEQLYLIYVISTKDSAQYKIPTLKDSNACRNISVGSVYPFVLHSMTTSVKLNNIPIDIGDIPHITRVSYYGNWILLEPAGVKDIRQALNVSSLCLQ